jgi:hypothetical protein
MNDEKKVDLERWHLIVFERDWEDLQDFLAEDVVFYSPFLWKPYYGRQAAWPILTTVAGVFQDFQYHRQLVDGDNWALEFSANISELSLKGIDLIHVDENRQIDRFEVFIRPANGLQALGAEMAQRLS